MAPNILGTPRIVWRFSDLVGRALAARDHAGGTAARGPGPKVASIGGANRASPREAHWAPTEIIAMETEQSRLLVKNAWATFASRDPDRIAALFADDAEWLAPHGNATAVALDGPNQMVGGHTIATFIATGMRRLFLDVAIEFRGVYADGPVVIVEERMSASLPNGGRYVNDYCFVFECRDGRIARVREYMDTLNGHRQLFANGHPLASREEAAVT
jgi:ketosteroid isomerase-like protein